MALAKWFGTGPTPTSGSGSGEAGPSSTDHAKSAVISKAEHKQFGLENFGNTCYVNSVLQALYFCHPFRELVLQVVDKSNPPVSPSTYSVPPPPPPPIPTNPRAKNQRKLSTADVPRVSDGTTANGSAPLTGPPIPTTPPTMFSALRALFMHISHNMLDKGTVAPRSFVEKLKKENELFRSTMHQDAHEFLIFLLNKIAEDLEEEVRNVRSGSSSKEDLSNSVTSSGPSTNTSGSRSTSNSTIVHDLFEGVLTSETRCLTCETVSARDEAFLDLSIDIEQNSSVTACLRQFSASEMLCQKNKFFCDACCGLQEAEKRMKIKRLPNVLALHLKRFKYQEDVQKYIKLAYRVAFPLELRLFNTVDDAQDPDRLYELFAIVVHIGTGPHHGHYIAIVKSNGAWLVFDDDTVDTIKESDISKYFGDSNSGSAYVLYYQALDLDMQTLGLKLDEPVPTESAAESSSLRVPLLPPGLTHEGDSDASEFAPTTPASPALQSVPTIVPGSPTPLTVSIPPPQSSSSISIPAPTLTAATSSPNGKHGFFNSLRHSPSKPSFGQTSGGSVSDSMPPPPMPPLPPSAFPPQISSESSEASTSDSTSTSTPIAPNGKAKVSKEKSSGWFARKRSIRIEKEKPPDSGKRPGTVHDSRERHDAGSFTSSASSSRTPHTREASPSKRPSTADAHSPSPAFSTPPTSPPPLPSNLTSPTFSHNGFPTTPTTPSLFPNHDSHQTSLSPGHKKSQPVLTSHLPNGESRSIPTARPPKRPSTAGASPSPTHGAFMRLNESPPPVPPRSELRPAVPRPRAAANDPSVSQDERDRRRFSTQVPPPSSTTSKRASRKLSFTSGMLSLGFSRKDKDKHRNNDLSGPLSPTSVNAPSMVHGLSLSGRM